MISTQQRSEVMISVLRSGDAPENRDEEDCAIGMVILEVLAVPICATCADTPTHIFAVVKLGLSAARTGPHRMEGKNKLSGG